MHIPVGAARDLAIARAPEHPGWRSPGTYLLTGSMIVLLVVTSPWWTNNELWIDDFLMVQLQRDNGFWSPSSRLNELLGYYRFAAQILMSPQTFVFADHAWLLKLIGVVLHSATAGMGFRVLKHWQVPLVSRVLFLALFLFWPYALEGIAWPTALTYPLAPFTLFLGLRVAVGESRRVRLAGAGMLLGFSATVHEQAGPLALALAVIAVLHLPKRRDGVYLMIPTVSIAIGNLAMIWLTRASNNRLSGGDAGLSLVFQNIAYISQLVKTSPFGDFYWYEFAPVLLVAPVVLVVVTAMGFRVPAFLTIDIAKPNGVTWLCAGLMTAAYGLCLIPVLMSPSPWHTPRVAYMPTLALSLAITFLVTVLLSHFGKRCSNAFPTIVWGMTILVASWATWSLLAESRAYALQSVLNRERAESASRIVGFEETRPGSFLAVGGFPGTDVNRPQFGEHIIGLTKGQFTSQLALGYAETRQVIFSSGLENICLKDDKSLDLTPAVRSMVLSAGLVVEQVSFLTYSQSSGWSLTRTGESVSDELQARLLVCQAGTG